MKGVAGDRFKALDDYFLSKDCGGDDEFVAQGSPINVLERVGGSLNMITG